MILPVLLHLAVDAPRLKVGTTWSGIEELRYQNSDAEIDQTERYKLVYKITASNNGLLIGERRSDLISTTENGATIPPPKGQTTFVTKCYFDPAGFLLQEIPFNTATFKIDRLLCFWLPDNKPDTWGIEMVTQGQHFLPKTQVEFRMLRNEGAGARSYAFTSDMPKMPGEMKVTGTVRFDLKTGKLLAAKLKSPNAVLPGGTEHADVTITYTDSSIH